MYCLELLLWAVCNCGMWEVSPSCPYGRPLFSLAPSRNSIPTEGFNASYLNSRGESGGSYKGHQETKCPTRIRGTRLTIHRQHMEKSSAFYSSRLLLLWNISFGFWSQIKLGYTTASKLTVWPWIRDLFFDSFVTRRFCWALVFSSVKYLS